MPQLPPDLLQEASEAGQDALADLVDGGMTEHAALDLIARVLDAALPLALLIPGPLGQAAEAADGAAIRAALGKAAELLEPNPDRIEARARKAIANGHALIAARRFRRAANVRNRQG